jgi:DNA-binding IclR family transcriptional regulator
MKKTVAKTKYFVPALEKSLDILEALAIAVVPQSLADLSRTLKRTPSELFRMLDALERRAYISRDVVSEGYYLTLKLYELAHTHSPVDHLLRAAAVPMRELAETIHESCHLSILHGQMLMVIAQAESPEPVRLSIEVGYRVLPLTTASGKILVSMLEESSRQRFLEADLTYASMNHSDRQHFDASVLQIRKARYYVAHSTRRTGIDISCVVGNPEIDVSAALGVPIMPGGPNQGKEKKLLSAIQKCANEITDKLGLGHR